MTNHTADEFRTARFAEHRTRPDLNAVRNADGMWVTGDRSTFLDDQHIRSNGSYRPVREAAPISLDALRTAWENAETISPDDPPRRGDTIIINRMGEYTVAVADVDGAGVGLGQHLVRILSRAPQREPWADLADVLAVEMPGADDAGRLDALAGALYREHGVRVTGGDEK